jgi:hypothetical protein
MCPYYLDGDRTPSLRTPRGTGLIGSVIPVAATLIVVTASATVQFSRAAGSRPAGLAGRSLKTQQHAPAAAARYAQLAGPGSVDVLGRTVGVPPARCRARELVASDGLRRAAGDGAVPYGPLDQGLPRKEVIQPHLPVRLPCYDFTPVTSPTFDGSLPCGLGHRLRVLLTPVV